MDHGNAHGNPSLQVITAKARIVFLHILEHQEQGFFTQRHADIAEATHIASGTVTAAVWQLCHYRLIEQHTHPEDMRRSVYRLVYWPTPDERRLLEDAAANKRLR